jgi:6-phosphogluconate dehydrogenase
MPGGRPEAWKLLEPVWTAIAAKVDAKTGKPLTGAAPGKPIQGGDSCAVYIGPDGAGHYVKMVHNGIEYADMQMICEAYHLMRQVGGLSPAHLSDTFAKWNAGDLDSFLIEITADILRQTDPVTGKPFVDVVLDAAGQKGTGKWTSTNALDFGIPANTIAEAVFARCMSAIKEERVAASRILSGPPEKDRASVLGAVFPGGVPEFVDAVGKALYCAKICSYAQGFQLMSAASDHYKWSLRFGQIAMIWRGGCIIRARFLQKIKEAYDRDGHLKNLLLDPYFAGVIRDAQMAWRKVLAVSAIAGVPAPAFASALAYYDGYRTETLPAQLLQAQRDYFGSHTYERTDQPRGKFFHLEWLEPGRPQREA